MCVEQNPADFRRALGMSLNIYRPISAGTKFRSLSYFDGSKIRHSLLLLALVGCGNQAGTALSDAKSAKADFDKAL